VFRELVPETLETGYNHLVACIVGHQAPLTGKKLKNIPALGRIVEG
jgi:hypothetical protein